MNNGVSVEGEFYSESFSVLKRNDNVMNSQFCLDQEKSLYKCPLCDKTFAFKYYVKRHLHIHSGSVQDFPSALSLSNAAKVNCEFLGTNCPSLEDLNLNYELCQEKPSKYCSLCNKAFSSSCHVKRHMLIHEGVKPFMCDICYKAFRQKVELKKHTRIHTGERPYECNLCDYRATQLCTLKSHMKAKHPEC